ncbi:MULTISPECIES: hypothetical protein [unclassified Collinsella]|uniref:hypothetical protein n=1 Tax=unclassified Collinsella TaxID=2637548 RepID=UPI000E49FD4F|nr:MULTISPECIES: hypothetical protein [unclassified Collinsella]RGT44319.1 hypothetical protein DWX25_09125 [Collinsella sp. AF18-8LB]RGT51561.1 hypothetical protein DWX24_03340 [Collinsella sp. AF18-8]RGT65837.1 hypothetical protein DWX16_05600 [Collinsella sp. AF18-33LB]
MDKQSDTLITFNDEPEDAISALNGAACLLKMLADSADAGTCPYKHIGDAYYTLGAVIEAATHKLGETVFSSDK